jgi:hypothetical protein
MATNKPRKKPVLTPERRAEIISRDYLSVADIMELTGLGESSVRIMLTEIKTYIKYTLKRDLRPEFAGLIHIDDYVDGTRSNPDRFVPDLLPKKSKRLLAIEKKYGQLFEDE